MPDRVHGHDVMKMMIEGGEAYSESTLRHAIVSRFGEETTYYTCSADNMSADELIVFLRSRGKFVGEDSGFTTQPDKICDH